MDDIIKQYTIKPVIWHERNLKILWHSRTVAAAAESIANQIETLDPQKAYLYGMMHDFGKFYLSMAEKYKHPSLGYELMIENYPDIAEICITHPFPEVTLTEYLVHYCNGDELEVEKILDYKTGIEHNDYIKLIQFCDKICGINEYLTLDYKFKWYFKRYPIERDLLEQRYHIYMELKGYFDKLSKMDTYDLFKFDKL